MTPSAPPAPADIPGAGTAAVRRWLSIIGVGEDGVEGLGPAARRAITEAAVVFGGRRHLRLVESLIRGRAAPWPSPIRDAIPEIEALRGSPVVGARVRRSVPLRHRLGARRAHCCGGNGSFSRAVVRRPRSGPAGLGGAGCRNRLAVRPAAGDAAAALAAEPAGFRPVRRQYDAAGRRAAADRSAASAPAG